MKKFFKENNRFDKLIIRAFFAIVVGTLIVGGVIYFSGEKTKINEAKTPGEPPLSKCGNIPELPDSSLKLATEIIDGDTFLIEGGYSVRILGIDADERGYPCYDAAKNRLEELILNKEVKLDKRIEDKDQWCRYLRYPFLKWNVPGSKEYQNIAFTLLEEGLVIAHLSPEDVTYRQEFAQAEKEARGNKIGCKWGQKETEEKKTLELQWERLTPETTGLKVIGVCQAGNYYGEEMIVEGKIIATYRSKTNTVSLNFEKPYPNQCFVGVIFSSDQYKFVQKPEGYYLNKTVRMKGEIKEHERKPEMILKEPSQIESGK